MHDPPSKARSNGAGRVWHELFWGYSLALNCLLLVGTEAEARGAPLLIKGRGWGCPLLVGTRLCKKLDRVASVAPWAEGGEWKK